MTKNTSSPGFATQCLHAGTPPEAQTGARQTPIFQTTSYVFKNQEHAAKLFGLKELGFIYSRLTNPTISALEERLAALEGGAGATATASGHAAQLMVFSALLQPDCEIIAAKRLYGGTINQLSTTFPRCYGWRTIFVDDRDPANIAAAITDKTRAIFIESIANPGGGVTDIAAIAAIAKKAGVPLIVDNTMATPYLCRPIEFGADIVIHSTTKFISGNGTSTGGVVIDSGKFDWAGEGDRYPALAKPDAGYHGLEFHQTFGEMAMTFHGHAVGLRDLGVNQQPFNAFLTLLGLETLGLRMDRHVQNAQAVAEHLAKHPAVRAVDYAGLPTAPDHDLAKKYTPKGPGAVFTFRLKGGYDAGVSFVDRVQLLSHVANIGDSRSLVIHPASTTHSQLAPEDREASGAGAEVVRLSVGLEDIADIIADIDQALT